MSKHEIVHIELSAHDREAIGSFYSELFGWSVQQLPDMNYATFSAGEGVGGGFNPVQENFPAGMVTFYVQTDDIEASLKKVETLGGKALVHKTEIPGVGWFGFFEDPTGNKVGLITMPES